MSKNTAVFGIFPSEHDAADAVERLRQAGFRSTDVSILVADNAGSKDLAHEKHTKAPEGAAAGAGTGAVLGGALGWLAGLGSLAIPGLGPFIAAGPILSLLSGVGVGGTVGGFTGALIGAGFPEYEAKRYEGRIRDGGVLLSVHCDANDWTKTAKEILERSGARDISSTGEAKADFASSDVPRPRSPITHS
jgi:Heat induced stress protein YflT domain/Alternative complex III, ActD subunit